VDDATRIEVEAVALRHLVAHLREARYGMPYEAWKPAHQTGIKRKHIHDVESGAGEIAVQGPPDAPLEAVTAHLTAVGWL